MYQTTLRLAPSQETLETSNNGNTNYWPTFEASRAGAEGQFLLAVTSPGPDLVFCQVIISANGTEMFNETYETLDPTSTRRLSEDLDKVAKTAPKDMEFFKVTCYHTTELFDTPTAASKRSGELVEDAYVDVVIRKVPVTIPADESTGKKALEAAKRILNIDGEGDEPEIPFPTESEGSEESSDSTAEDNKSENPFE